MIVLAFITGCMVGATLAVLAMALMTVASDDDRSRGYDAVLPSDLEQRRETVRWFIERGQRGR